MRSSFYEVKGKDDGMVKGNMMTFMSTDIKAP
jgi:hypothetical protein